MTTDQSVKFPDFQSIEFLTKHSQKIFNFYDPRCIDPAGGFYQTILNNGEVIVEAPKHLVSSCRLTLMFARMSCLEHEENIRQHYLDAVQHGIDYLRQIHRNCETQGYAWMLQNHQPSDRTNHAYGLMFVLLAYAWAFRAGIETAKSYLYETFDLLEQKFWLPEFGLYADEYDSQWQCRSDYRGQNANMHGCEAMLAAYQATEDIQFLDRACLLADHVVNRQTKTTDGLIWEHYHPDWTVDWEYNKQDPKNLYRPWGFQPGHLSEWAKLLVQCYQYRPEPWMISRAQRLFTAAIESGWDYQHGGLVYGFGPDGQICDRDKYFWVQAESLAAAAYLAVVTDREVFWTWYQEIWRYCWQHFVDHQYGAWYRLLSADNQPVDDLKSTPGGKCDYHTLGACLDVMSVMNQ